MMTIALTLLTYLELYIGVSNIARPVQTVFASSEGPAAEMYPDYMGQYNILRDVYRHDRAVYKHVDRGDRFIFYNGSHINVYYVVVLTKSTHTKTNDKIKQQSLIRTVTAILSYPLLLPPSPLSPTTPPPQLPSQLPLELVITVTLTGL